MRGNPPLDQTSNPEKPFVRNQKRLEQAAQERKRERQRAVAIAIAEAPND